MHQGRGGTGNIGLGLNAQGEPKLPFRFVAFALLIVFRRPVVVFGGSLCVYPAPFGAKSKRIFLSADSFSPTGATGSLLPQGSFIVIGSVAGNALENAPSSKKSVGFVSAVVVLVMSEPFVLLLLGAAWFLLFLYQSS